MGIELSHRFHAPDARASRLSTKFEMVEKSKDSEYERILVEGILEDLLGQENESYALGKTKTFFAYGVLEKLEKLRVDIMEQHVS